MQISPRYDGPPIISIEGTPRDQLAPVARQRRRLNATLAELSASDWKAPSRCAQWSIQDVAAHLDGVNRFWHLSVTAGLGGTPTRILAGFDPAATPPLMVAGMRDLDANQVLDQVVESNETLVNDLEALDDAGWETLAESPAGHVPIRMLAAHTLWDCWIHERDIALPLGATPDIVPDEVASCLCYGAALSPAFALSFGSAAQSMFAIAATDPDTNLVLNVGECVTVTTGVAAPDVPCLRGDAVELVEAVSLRVPLPSSAPPEWTRVLGGLMAAFDSEAQTA